MRHTEPTLDGMPEPPPAWVRPDEGVRLGAAAFDWMLLAALVHCGTDEQLPSLMGIRLSVTDGRLTAHATDRYTALRERVPVSQTCEDFAFLIRSEDAASLRVLLKSVLRGLKDEDRQAEPVDVALEQTDDGPTLRVLGQDLDVRFTEQVAAHQFPAIDPLIDRITDRLDLDDPAPFDVFLNPTTMARVVAAQKAGRAGSAFSYRSARSEEPGRPSPVVVRPHNLDEDDDLLIVVMPLTGAGEP